MTITVSKAGVPVSSNIKFVSASVFARGAKYTQHQIDGADEDFLLYRGRNSATSTITGYCLRSSANEAILDGLCDGSKLTVVHSVSGMRDVKATSWSPGAAGVYIQFTLAVTEQINEV